MNSDWKYPNSDSERIFPNFPWILRSEFILIFFGKFGEGLLCPAHSTVLIGPCLTYRPCNAHLCSIFWEPPYFGQPRPTIHYPSKPSATGKHCVCPARSNEATLGGVFLSGLPRASVLSGKHCMMTLGILVKATAGVMEISMVHFFLRQQMEYSMWADRLWLS